MHFLRTTRLLALLLVFGGLMSLAQAAETQQITGKVLSVVTGPSNYKLEHTNRGVHLIVVTTAPEASEPVVEDSEPLPAVPSAIAPGKTLNLHLGPSVWLQKSLNKIPKNQPLTFHVFKSGALGKDHYLVQSIETKTTIYQYRDKSMKPLWMKKR